jgi:hypothetical protein
MSWTYKKKPEEQLKNWYIGKVRNLLSGFIDFEDFKDWYEKKEKKCFYCGLTEEESQRIVHDGLLRSKRFPFNGEFSQGVNRAYWLEIDRKNPNDNIYSREKCELSCYFCNNDKSDVFTAEEYKNFLTDRIGFIRGLLKI